MFVVIIMLQWPMGDFATFSGTPASSKSVRRCGESGMASEIYAALPAHHVQPPLNRSLSISLLSVELCRTIFIDEKGKYAIIVIHAVTSME